MVDKQNHVHVSCAIASKSVSYWIVKRPCDDLESWGHMGNDLVIRCDGEPSLLAMRRSRGYFRDGSTTPADVAPGEHEQIGFVEKFAEIFFTKPIGCVTALSSNSSNPSMFGRFTYLYHCLNFSIL